jgi:GTP-binding protein EngB required for normal cell division
MEKIDQEINHQNLSRIFSENSQLFNSSANKDIVVFLGKTGSGKSTLINFLSGKKLGVDQLNKIVLGEQNDPSAMLIGGTGASQTLLPKFIESSNMIFFDLPGFNENRGTCHSLLGACFVKNIIEKARTVKIIFVAGEGEINENRAESVVNILNNAEKLIPEPNIKISSSIVITKLDSDYDINTLPVFLRQSTSESKNENLFNPWISLGRLGKMSKPSQKLINQGDKEQILNLISTTPSINIQKINVSDIYNINDTKVIENIYKNEIDRVVGLLIKNKFDKNSLSYNNIVKLKNDKQYFDSTFYNEALLNIENSLLISLLRPISENIYTSALNEKKETISLKIREISLLIEREIKEQEKKELEIEKQKQQKIISQLEEERKIKKFAGFTGTDNRFYVTSYDGKDWPRCYMPNEIGRINNVSLTNFKDKLFAGFTGTDNRFYVTSYDGKDWPQCYMPNEIGRINNISL